ncbi:MAG: hypothetical protein QXG65_03195 [Thermoplasmata archaeon]
MQERAGADPSVTLAYLGGIVYLASAVVVAVAGAIAGVAGVLPRLPLAGTVAGLLIAGILTVVFGYLLRTEPGLRLFWAIVLIAIALATLGVAFGGFVLGFVLTLIAGLLALARGLRPYLRHAASPED